MTRKGRARRPDDGNAFFRDPEGGPARAPEVLAEELAEEFIASATSGEEQGEIAQQAVTPEEEGGPFIEFDARADMAEAAASLVPMPVRAPRSRPGGRKPR